MNAINTEQIVGVFDRFKMPGGAIDQYERGGREALLRQVERFVRANAPVEFSMLGFPMKSPNEEHKVLGKLPDLGERVAFDRLARFVDEVGKVYEPGAKVSVISDGYVFSDLLGINDATVQRYGEACSDMARGTGVDLLDLRCFYPSIDLGRRKVMDQFGITSVELERRIMLDPNVNELYRGMIYFMTTDLAGQKFQSKSQLQKEAKRLAREMMLRNEAYSAFVRSEFGGHVRLSMHNSTNNGTKYSFALIPGERARHSPWHSALAVDSHGGYETVHKAAALERGYELVTKDGVPYAFQTEKFA